MSFLAWKQREEWLPIARRGVAVVGPLAEGTAEGAAGDRVCQVVDVSLWNTNQSGGAKALREAWLRDLGRDTVNRLSGMESSSSMAVAWQS